MSVDQAQQTLVDYVRDAIIGKDEVILTPFGSRKITYCDYTASSKPIDFIEEYVKQEVLPIYANTHTTSSFTGHQTMLFREEARVIVARSINARDDKDALVFTGCGVTGAINHLIRSMRLWPPRDMPAEERPIVFIGPHEHHSNILPWRESICEVVSIPEDPATGILDETVLEEQLIKYKSRPMRIGSFSAASNVTGILIDTIKVTRLLKSHGALAFWDFASAGPYIEIDMNPLVLGEGQTDYHLAYKDAIFLSPHKLVGGVSSPGVLCAKKVLFNRELPPGNSGGGTIDFVTDKDHVYLNKIQEREEGGTPDIVGCIRAGLAFQLKNAVTTEVIEKKEHDFATRALARMTANPRIHVLGPLDAKRLAVISFVIFHQSGKLLHYNFVCALLNDLFGIQCRGGCVCAGPYGQQLLGIDKVTSKKYEEQITGYDDVEAIRPGFVRISFNFFTDEREFNFVLDAIDFVATHGWKFLPEYGFLPETNEWQHTRNARKLPGRKWLGEISYATGKMEYPRRVRDKASLDDLSLYMPLAKKALQESEKEYEANKAVNALDESKELLRGEAEFLRWFVYPAEAYVRNVDIDNDTNNIRHKAWRLKMMRLNPFVPKFYGASGDQAKNDVVISHNKEDLAPTSCGTNGGVCAPGVCAPRPTVSSQPTEEADRERWSVKDMVVERSAAKAATEKTPAQPAVVTPSHSHVAAEPSTAGKPNGEYERGKPWKKLRNKPQKHSSPEEVDHHIFSTMRRALKDFDMIKPHDKVLIGVSGGKDSLTLLHMFMKLRKHIPLELAAVTLDPQTLEFDPSPLKGYMKDLGIKYFYEEHPIIQIASDVDPSSLCGFCSRMKRGILHTVAVREGYNVLALGQHFDDLAESWLMYAFHNGQLDTIKATNTLKGGKLKLVRPFVYVRERETKQYARLHNLPVITENCPACFEEPKERARLKALLKAQETLYPTIFPQLVAALRPLMHPDFHADKIFKDLSKNRAEQRQESFLSLRAFAKELREKEAATSDEHEGTTSPLTEPAEVPTPALN